MSTLITLQSACSANPESLPEQAEQQTALWENWLRPVTSEMPAGEDPGYNDDFQQMREEVNKLSGADTTLTCELAEKLLTAHCKDVRVATYYIWARLHRDGEAGLADALSLLAGLITRFGESLHPQRANSRRTALEWLAGSRVLDSLSLFPEVNRVDFARIVGALALIEQGLSTWETASRPQLGALYTALENRLAQSGGFDAVVPQNSAASGSPAGNTSADSPALKPVASGRDLLDQGKLLAKFLRDQPDGWLSGNHLMKSIRLDTLHELPPLAADGRTRLMPPKPEHRALLKRLYLQQSWLELLEQTDSLFAQGVNHLWLDLQWYVHQALTRAGAPYESWAGIIEQDLSGLLTRLPGLEGLAFSDGTPFADEVTMNWITQQVTMSSEWSNDSAASASTAGSGDDDILQLEPEALAQADSDGVEAALGWLQNRPGTRTPRHQWLIRLLMARVAEQYGKNDMALHLLGELDGNGARLTLTQWEPDLLFEVKARRLKLLRIKASRADADKPRLQGEMESLLAGLISLDPARAAVLCG
ncbi:MULTISPECIES: type VI secretion system protein TssA [Rahnella]|uniref:Type VI secretion system protein TssA n=1 Tax=Rahnella laticis TaxID=2787622 RepID=A0ABS0E1N5_9GAMM|nr:MULTISPECIES: type VI secretion system protein TssA [Rahnella]MBF7978986.1 type VI secretion system protein TssA [Rahnella laticis]MBF7999076.1 type VI secretion system protein TssA [Rahnella sp. LAC-M12]